MSKVARPLIAPLRYPGGRWNLQFAICNLQFAIRNPQWAGGAATHNRYPATITVTGSGSSWVHNLHTFHTARAAGRVHTFHTGRAGPLIAP